LVYFYGPLQKRLLQMKPLAERLRPQTLDEVIGQQHLIGEGKILRKLVESKNLSSFILWGPPGVGKTTLAQIIAQSAGYTFFNLSAINAGVKEVREVITQAAETERAVLFIDEIHRFSKSQQDALLGAVEKGIVRLIGATTENPSFEVNSALLSRCHVYVLESLSEEELITLIHRTFTNDTWIAEKQIKQYELDAMIQLSGGDARKLLNIIELVVESVPKGGEITNAFVSDVVQKKSARYDKAGEMHYDIVSAMIKSIRGSDPDAAVYWLARMIEGGEDVAFIARRLLISASEDIGNANPTAMVMATSTMSAVQMIGYPESRIILSQLAIYLASSPKSNASYEAINKAQQLVRTTGDLPVPLHLRNAPTKLMKQMDYGKNYQYPHSYEGSFIEQQYMPDALTKTKLYEPGNNPRENELKNYLKSKWKNKY
jgi:putative ATPase